MSDKVRLLVKQWGNGLAVRLPMSVSRAAKLSVGQEVELTVEKDVITITPIGQPKLTLTQKLDMFDPQKHGSEETLK